MQFLTYTHQLLLEAQTLQLATMLNLACARLKHYLKALHPEAAVLHLEEQLLS